ncbi:MAG TPA: hypothetical protein VMW52_12555 [Phycisphaerae bacterium]|nr:hypothetical protein [Phycisphaerae bacterium]
MTRAGYGYGTHLPALIHCVLRTSGPILELGAGRFSTPILHQLCSADQRRIVTAEEPGDWLATYEHLRTDWHEFIRSYDAEVIDAIQWSVVLIDHAMDRRNADLQRLADRASFIVVHDTNCTKYGYDFAAFRYRRDWDDLSPTTAVVSNEEQP